MAPENPNNENKRNIAEIILHRALLMTEAGMNLKERFLAGEKHLSYLKSLVHEAEHTVSSLQNISKSSLHLAWQLTLTCLADEHLPPEVKMEFQRLSNIIDKQLNEYEFKNINETSESPSMLQLSEKIKFLETKQKFSEINLPGNTISNKCFKADIDEKYPENLSRESLIDLNNVTNLPTVPEDIFTSFSNNKPTRSSSLSSLKSMRKIKLFLQKAESSDEDESSDNDEHEYSRLIYGDSDDSRTSCGSYSPMSKKVLLGNIKEEAQD